MCEAVMSVGASSQIRSQFNYQYEVEFVRLSWTDHKLPTSYLLLHWTQSEPELSVQEPPDFKILFNVLSEQTS